MPLDPTNPTVPADQSLVDWRVKDIAAKEKAAEAATLMAQAASGEPVTEGGLYASFLRAVLMGQLAASSNDAQIWATDLTKDYLLKYDLAGNPRQQ